MEQRSIETRARIVQVAYELFCAQGFRATTMEAIADAVGVSVQTVYFQFKNKPRLLRAVHEWTVLGEERLPPPLQPWHVAAMQEADARDALAGIAKGTATLNARIAPMLPIFESLAQGPGGEIYRESKRRRRQDMDALVDALAAKTPLRAETTRQRAADLVYFLMGPESYAELVLEMAWPPNSWSDWVSETLNADLFRR